MSDLTDRIEREQQERIRRSHSVEDDGLPEHGHEAEANVTDLLAEVRRLEVALRDEGEITEIECAKRDEIEAKNADLRAARSDRFAIGGGDEMRPLSPEDKLLIAAVNKKVQGGHRSQSGASERSGWTPPPCFICGKPIPNWTQADSEAEEDKSRKLYCSSRCFLNSLALDPQKAPRKFLSHAGPTPSVLASQYGRPRKEKPCERV